MSKPLRLGIMALITACIAGFYYNRYRIAPDITTKEVAWMVGDERVAMNTLQGEDVAFVFYASWCGPCLREMQSLRDLHPEFESKGVRIIALTDDDDAKIERIRSKFNLPFEMYSLEKTLHDYDIYTIPTAYVFDQDGQLVFEQVDAMDWTDRNFLDKLFSDLD